MVIYPNLCPLFPPRFALLPEFVKSLEKGLTTTSAEIILVARGAYFAFRLPLCVFVCVVYVLSDLTRCSRFGHWFPPNQPTTRQTGAWRGTRCSSAPHLYPADCLELILAALCCLLCWGSSPCADPGDGRSWTPLLPVVSCHWQHRYPMTYSLARRRPLCSRRSIA